MVSGLYDYDSGKTLAPGATYVVVGSAINLCMREHFLMDTDFHFRLEPNSGVRRLV